MRIASIIWLGISGLLIVFFLFSLVKNIQSPTKIDISDASVEPSRGALAKLMHIPPTFQPTLPSVEHVFFEDHTWVATLSASRVRTLLATGDVIPARSVNFQTIRRGNFTWPFQKTAHVTSQADITLVNLETPLFDDCKIANEGMIFCGDSRHLEGLVLAGVDVANIANNHAGNYGIQGIERTITSLITSGIGVSGSGGPVIKDIRGVTFAFLGYNDIGAPEKGIAWANNDNIIQEVAAAKSQSDIVIVSFHWGPEYVRFPSDRQKELGHLAIDAGADVVIGNHPHWFQPVEIYKGKYITYAHGNFVFDQMWSEETQLGVVGTYTFYDTQLIDIEFLPIKILDYGQPYFLEGEEKKRLLETMKRSSLELKAMAQ